MPSISRSGPRALFDYIDKGDIESLLPEPHLQ
jgi:hypothetical protein